MKETFWQRFIVASRTSVEPFTDDFHAPWCFHAALYAWLILYGTYRRGSWVIWSQQSWCLISLMHQKTFWLKKKSCSPNGIDHLTRYSFHLPHPPLFILSRRLNLRWERSVSIVYVYNEMPQLPPLLSPRSGSDHSIKLVSGSTTRVSLGSNPP